MNRLFYYESYQEDELPYLDSKAVAKTFEEMKQEYEGEYLLNQIKQFFDAYTLQSTKYVKLNRGLLLYGPPGTGKTQITSGIANVNISLIYTHSLIH
jgi:DNA replication protein DnaC